MKTGVVEFKAGAPIFEEGGREEDMFVIEAGSVEIFRSEGGVPRPLRALEAGDFFGEMGLLDAAPRMASARAVTDCRLLVLDASGLDALLRAHPEVAIRMLRTMAARLREAGAVPPAPAPEPAPNTDARELLVTSDGVEIPLSAAPEITLGRPDAVSGFRPDIDLGPLDTQRMTSRRHAKLVRDAGALFLLEDVGTANGTFLNAKRLAPGVRAKVADGDTLRFGGVSLIYRAG